jgi:hypothetical protein
MEAGAMRLPYEATFHLDPDARRAVTMHDEFEMDLTEGAFTMEQSVQETAALLEQARPSLHQQGAAPPRATPSAAATRWTPQPSRRKAGTKTRCRDAA